jgi:hypothetical protein
VAELLGAHSYQLDPKGRLSLPARFREALADGVWVTIGQNGSIARTRSPRPPFPTRRGARTPACSSDPPMSFGSTRRDD